MSLIMEVDASALSIRDDCSMALPGSYLLYFRVQAGKLRPLRSALTVRLLLDVMLRCVALCNLLSDG